MKIYFISQWYYPEPDGRVSNLAEELANRGHDVTVITAFPNYPHGKIYDGYKIKWRQWETINGVRVLRLPIFPDHSRSPIKRALNYFSFFLSLFVLAPWFIKKPDVFWVYMPFMVIPACFFKFIYSAPYVLEITDLWPDTIFASGMLKEGCLSRILNAVANIGYKYSGAITVQNPGFKTCLVERGVNEKKVFIVENWADEKIFKPKKYDLDLAKKINLQEKFIVMFAGNMGIAQNLENIIESAILCKQYKEIHYVFIGDGVCLAETKDKAHKSDLKNISFLGRKPIKEIPIFFSIADVLLVSLRDEPLYKITLPSKTQAYLASKKPIVIAKNGEDAEFLEKNGCAIKCIPDNPASLADAIIRIYKMTNEERILMGNKGLELYKKKYAKKHLVDKMENIFLKLCRQK